MAKGATACAGSLLLKGLAGKCVPPSRFFDCFLNVSNFHAMSNNARGTATPATATAKHRATDAAPKPQRRRKKRDFHSDSRPAWAMAC